MIFGLHPAFLFAAVTLLGAIVCAVLACQASAWRNRVLLAGVSLILLGPSLLLIVALKPELVDARFRTYKEFYEDIQIGMTRAEVMAVLDGHYPENGERSRPTVFADTDTQLGFFMNPEKSSEPNCEGIILEMQNGKVTGKSYSPD